MRSGGRSSASSSACPRITHARHRNARQVQTAPHPLCTSATVREGALPLLGTPSQTAQAHWGLHLSPPPPLTTGGAAGRDEFTQPQRPRKGGGRPRVGEAGAPTPQGGRARAAAAPASLSTCLSKGSQSLGKSGEKEGPGGGGFYTIPALRRGPWPRPAPPPPPTPPRPLPDGVAPKTLTTGTLLTGASLKGDWQGSRPGRGLLM